jgi:hypothetical protein
MRRIVILLLAATTLCAQGEPPHSARLAKGVIRYKLGHNYALPDGVEVAEQHALRTGRVERHTVFFADMNGNGDFSEEGIDGWLLKDMRYILPLEKTAVIERSHFVWKVAEDGSRVHYDFDAVPGDKAQLKTLRQFNYWRLINGLPPVTIDPDLSDACSKHCTYMEHNGFFHVEKPENTGYTPEGAEAGLRSCIGEEGPGMSVLMFYASFYHRLPLIKPDTRAIGIGFSRRYACVSGLSAREPRPWNWPVIVPAPTSALHPTHFAREYPRPHPEGIEPGFPITVTFRTTAITDAEARLCLKNEKGRLIPTLVYSPENPPNKLRPRNRNSICVIPRKPLPPRKTYWIRVSWKRNGDPESREWKFATAHPRPVHRRVR